MKANTFLVAIASALCSFCAADAAEIAVLGYQTPGDKGGLSLLMKDGDGNWDYVVHKDCRVMASNLGNWGEKEVKDPFIVRDRAGAYHVFHVYAARPALCHAMSWNPHNLRNWGRENWIELGNGERGMGNGEMRVAAPVVELDGKGMFLVRFLDKKSGKAYKVTTDGKVALGPCAEIAKDEYDEAKSRLLKTVEFDGRKFVGGIVKITPAMREFLKEDSSEWHKSAPWHLVIDDAKDDGTKYAETAKNAKLKFTVESASKAYAISPMLLGIFFEDINSSHEIFTVKRGWREDMVKALKDLKPKFMRFPGGCIVHGRDFRSMYHWKETVGPHGTRKGKPNPCWGGFQDFELGYYEYFVLCEKIGATPVPILPAGVSCPNPQIAVSDEELATLVADTLDLVEFANGDPAKSKWAKLRADMGHPKPFNLKYIGLGNEDDINDYFERGFSAIYKALKKKHPEIKVVGSAGPTFGGRDYEEGWKLGKKMHVDILDEHYYVGPGWFYGNQRFYDDYDRKGPKVYVGEYAAHKHGRVNDMETALACAIHLCNLERNGDIVEMASYAPLFAKRSDMRWAPDLIYFTDETVELTTDYWTQWIFGNFAGEKYVPCKLEVASDNEAFRNRFAASVVRSKGKTIVKLVNSTPFPMPLEADLSQLKVKPGTKASVTVLQGGFDDKTAKPETHEEKLSAKFSRTLPHNSLTVICW